MVAERTGYDPEELESDLELEADLGIDTVKQAEIVSQLRSDYHLTQDQDFRLADHPTLQALADYIVSRIPASTKTTAAATETTTSESTASETATAHPIEQEVVLDPTLGDGFQIQRVLWKRLPDKDATHGHDEIGELLQATQTALILSDDSDRALSVWKKMTGQNGTPTGKRIEVLDMAWCAQAPIEDLERRISDIRRQSHGHLSVFVLLTGSQTAAHSHTNATWAARASFRLAKVLARQSDNGAELPLLWWTVVPAVVAKTHDEDQMAARPVDAAQAAMLGLTRTLNREWLDRRVLLHLVERDLLAEPEASNADVAETLRRTARATASSNELLATSRGLWTVTMHLPNRAHPRHVTQDGVVLITGGLGGVGSITTRAVADLWGCRIAMVGRRPEPTGVTPSIPDRKAVRDQLRQAGKPASPLNVDQELERIRRDREAHLLLDELKAKSIDFMYLSADLTNPDQVQRLMEAIAQRWGRLDLIVHAAGVEKSQRLPDKAESEFDLVMQTKADAARHLIKAARSVLSNRPPVISYGSVAGLFGNPGQIDYAAANTALTAIGDPDRNADMVIHWTAWDGIGMTSGRFIRKSLEDRGVAMLPPAKGAEAIRRLLATTDGAEFLVSGPLGELGDRVPRPSLLISGGGNGNSGGGPRPWHVTNVDMNVTLNKDLTWIAHHSLDGVGLLPAVAGTTMMCEAATLAVGNGWRLASVEEARYLKPVKVQPTNPRTVIVNARDAGRRGLVRASVQTRIERGPRKGTVQDHFTCLVRFTEGTDTQGAEQQARIMPGTMAWSGPGATKIYEHFFHGPSFQVLDHIRILGNDGLVAEARPLGLPVAQLLASQQGTENQSQSTSTQAPPAMAIEAAMQAAGYLAAVHGAPLVLPTGIDRVRTMAPPAEIERADRWIVRVQRGSDIQDQQTVRFDAEILDQDARLLMAVSGIELSATAREQSDSFDLPVRTIETVEVRLEDLGNEGAMSIDLSQWLTARELERASAIRHPGRRLEWIAGRMAAKKALQIHVRDHLGIHLQHTELEILPDPNGAPQARALHGLVDLPSLSITHAAGRAICAIMPASQHVGIDLTPVEERSDDFVQQWFTHSERILVTRHPGSTAWTVSAIWAIKEAVSKVLGLGLKLATPEMEVMSLGQDDGRADVRLSGMAATRLAEMGGGTIVCGFQAHHRGILAWAAIPSEERTIAPLLAMAEATRRIEPKSVLLRAS